MAIASKPQRHRSSRTGIRELPASAARTNDRYRPGELIDKYQLVRAHGAGGMGTVWVAHDIVLDVDVAIKLIVLEKDDAAKALSQRLLEEARAAARLGHPGIIRVHDFGQTVHGDPFIAMELLEGEDLAAMLERQTQLTPVEAVQLLLPIAHALAAAHEKNIVHRDVKPENIFLARMDAGIAPKLLDFGIARIVDSPRKLTLEGAVLGTPDYMSPEQACGDATAPHTDLWSFCVVLYELVTLHCPFDGANYNALLRAIIEQEPRSFSAFDVLDEKLWRIVRRGLEKKPLERWRSMRELGEVLAVWLLERGISEDVMGTSLKRSWLRDAEGSALIEPPRVGEQQTERTTGCEPNASLFSDGRGPARTQSSSGVARLPGEALSTRASEPTIHAEQTSTPDLEAIAELNRGGDPLVLLERAARRRAFSLGAWLIFLAMLLAFAVLFGTGIIVL